jgi:hypothetical protein
MPSHIFARLGLWQEDIQYNLASIAERQKASTMHMDGGLLGVDSPSRERLDYRFVDTWRSSPARSPLMRTIPEFSNCCPLQSYCA